MERDQRRVEGHSGRHRPRLPRGRRESEGRPWSKIRTSRAPSWTSRRPKGRKASAAQDRDGVPSREARKASRAAPARPSAAASRSANASFESVIQSITGGVSIARAAIAEASGQGASAVRRAAGTASRASRRTVTRLADEWRRMEPREEGAAARGAPRRGRRGFGAPRPQEPEEVVASTSAPRSLLGARLGLLAPAAPRAEEHRRRPRTR